MKKGSDNTGRVWSWDARSVTGIECFRAKSFTHRYSRHSHEAYAIAVIEAGLGGNLFRGARDYVQAGDIVVMNPDEPHTGYAADGHSLSYSMLYVEPAAFRQMLPERTRAPYFSSAYLRNDYWAKRLLMLHRVLGSSTEAIEQQSHAHEILTGFAGVYGDCAIPERTGREPHAVRCVKEFLRSNYFRSLNIDEIAGLTQLSRAYLIRSFRRSVGIPPYRWLLQIRVEQAKKLLSQGLPIADVALDVGFADQSHLTRCFKSITGLTPGQYAAGHYRSRRA